MSGSVHSVRLVSTGSCEGSSLGQVPNHTLASCFCYHTRCLYHTIPFHSPTSRTFSDAVQHQNTRLTYTEIVHQDRIRTAIEVSRRIPNSNAEDQTSSKSWTGALRNHSHIVLPCHYQAGITPWTLVFEQIYTPNEMAGQGAGPSRRSHTKSRKGCKTCKRRHIRCDETFPQWYVCLCGEWSAVETDGYAAETARSIRSAAITWRAWDQIPKARVGVQNSTHSPSHQVRRVAWSFGNRPAAFRIPI